LSRDKLAGGAGLGVLDTKSKHFIAPTTPSQDVSIPKTLTEYTSATSAMTPRDASLSQTTTTNNTQPASSTPGQTSQGWSEAQELQAPELGPEYYDSQLHFPGTPLSPEMYSFMDQSPGIYEIGNIYHDMTFDLVHFNVTGCAGQPEPPESSMNRDDAIESRLVSSLAKENASRENNLLDLAMSGTDEAPTGNQEAECIDKERTTDHDSSAMALLALSKRPHYHRGPSGKHSHLSVTAEKREELLDFIAEIRPVRPDGSLLDGDSADFSLENMQTYLDLFLEHFNTSYPLIHVATLDIMDADPIAVLCMMLLGATYKDKDAHQLSVCLYDAVIPYILNNLLSSPVLDLSILQAFLVLECYGMVCKLAFPRF
jgi:hypothetical protein